MNALLMLRAALVLAAAGAAPQAARAAESYDNCTGFITSLPAVITTQGTWCLKSDLSTAISSGNAISINTNNVTLNCNDFKLGGLPAGLGTQASGILADSRLNVTVRRCNIRGFATGINVINNASSSGHVIEDNRFDGNTVNGIVLVGDESVIRRNRIFDTGQSSIPQTTFNGIYAIGKINIEGNVVSGVMASAGSNAYVYGIYTENDITGSIVGNQVSDLVVDGGVDYGIYNLNSGNIVVRGNDVFGNGTVFSYGLRCTGVAGRARDNEVANFATGIYGCTDVSGNDVH